jgi:hypothetical protein
MSLKNALQSLNNAVQDLTSLHVQTFTGELNVEIENADGEKKGFSDIRKEIQQGKQDGDLNLVAETLAQFDGDSYNFVKKDLTDVPASALEVHKNAVQSGIETRMGLLNLFKDLID